MRRRERTHPGAYKRIHVLAVAVMRWDSLCYCYKPGDGRQAGNPVTAQPVTSRPNDLELIRHRPQFNARPSILIMGGKAKKKAAAKKDSTQKPPKYVVEPASPAVTRVKSLSHKGALSHKL